MCPTTFRPDVPIEPSEKVPLHQAHGTRVAHFGSKFLSMGVGTQKIEGRFDVRNVTKPIVAAGQRSGSMAEFILDVKSARKIEELLGDRRGFVELRTQKGAHVTPCEEQSSNLFPLVEQEPRQGMQMDRGEVDVEEERQARVKNAPVPPDRQRERSTMSRMRRFAAGAKRVWQGVRQKIPTNVQQLNRHTCSHGLRIPRT